MVVMLWFVGIDQVIDALKIANIWLILLAIIMQIINYFLYTVRWEIINRVADIDFDFKKLFLIVMVGLGINNITPSGRGGGEPVRAYLLSRESKTPFEETFATVIADRALDTLPFIVLAVLTIVGVIFYYPLSTWIVVALIVTVFLVICVVFLVIYMSVNEQFGEKVIGWGVWLVHKFSKNNPQKWEEKVTKGIIGFQETMRIMISDKRIMYYAMPISVLIWAMEIFRVYLIFLAFGATVSPIVIAEVFILSCLIGFIPALPGGLGVIDGTMILFFSTAGIPSSISAAATVIERLISYWMTTIIGMCLIPYFGSNILNNMLNPGDEELNEDFDNAINYMDKLEDSKSIEKAVENINRFKR